MNMEYAQITLAISDGCFGGMEGFSTISGRLPVSVFNSAVENGRTMGQSGEAHSVFIDLMDSDETQIGEKRISLDQAARILGLASETLVPMARQRGWPRSTTKTPRGPMSAGDGTLAHDRSH